jgi:hypothetical protein
MKQWMTTAALAALAAAHSHAAVIYEPTVISSSLRVSHFGANDNFGFKTYDNFTPGTSAYVEKLTWRGFWWDSNSPQPAPAPPTNVANWDFAIHASTGGVPGAQHFFETQPAAQVVETFNGTGSFGAGDFYNVNFYTYSVVLNTPFLVQAGTEYWLSILSRSDDYIPIFVLRGATGGDDSSYQQTLGANMAVAASTFVARDRAVRIEGTEVPEPGTFAAAAAGLLALAILRGR